MQTPSLATDNPYLLRRAVKLERVASDFRSELDSGVLNRNDTVYRLILSCVGTMMEVPMTDLMYHQGQRACEARALCYYLIYKNSTLSYQKIGDRFRKAKSGVSVVAKQMKHHIESQYYPELTQVAQLTEQLLKTFVNN